MKKTFLLPNKWQLLRITRRLFQILSLGLFFFLIFATRALTGPVFDAENSGLVKYPVEAFLNIDPLASFFVIASTKTLPSALLASLIVLIVAIFMGKLFCGWICPMGTVNHGCSEISPGVSIKEKKHRNNFHRAQHIKYYLLIALLITALFGSAIGGLLDPISLLTRGMALTIVPIIDYCLQNLIGFLATSSITSLQQFSDKLYSTFDGIILFSSGVIVSGGILLTIFFIAVLVANRFLPRAWCRYICPLGALLGIVSRFSLISLKKDKHKCTNCGKCQRFCVAAASPHPDESWKRAECDLCMNCVAVCPEDALSFGLAGWSHDNSKDAPDLKKRKLLSSIAAGAVMVPAMRIGSLSSPQGRPDPNCIRPPGSLDETEFLKRCIRCGQCMKICPNNALHPAFGEAGIEGLWTPVLVPKIGYCEPTCTLCTQVCPTKAIQPVTEDQKTGKNKEELLRIGTAFIDRGRCLPYANEKPCTVCEEFCPMSPKAIGLEDVELESEGKTTILKRPYIILEYCIGCGACENACPVHDKAAIRVSSAGESRSRKNNLLL